MIQSVGAVLILWGILWALWDYGANAPLYLMTVGLACLLIGPGFVSIFYIVGETIEHFMP